MIKIGFCLLGDTSDMDEVSCFHFECGPSGVHSLHQEGREMGVSGEIIVTGLKIACSSSPLSLPLESVPAPCPENQEMQRVLPLSQHRAPLSHPLLKIHLSSCFIFIVIAE